MSLSYPIKDRAQRYASLQSNSYGYQMRSHDAGKAGHTCREDYITNYMYQYIIQIHVCVSSLHIIWHDLLFVL